MNTIQTQIILTHFDSGLSLPSGVQRDAADSECIASAATIGSTDATLSFGAITTPRQLMIKLIAGDELLVGYNGTDYNLSLADVGESLLLRFNQADIPDIHWKSVGSSNIAYIITPN